MVFNEISWLTTLFIILGGTQISIALVTVYFHRCVAHRAFILNNQCHRIFRFLSWFLMGMCPQEFAAVHRKHHAKCDQKEDPHSPVQKGWMTVLFQGFWLYKKEANNIETIKRYGNGMRPDSLAYFYKRHPSLGIFLFLLGLILLFGAKGVVIWAAHMLWIPLWAAGVINGLGHHVGYRNYPTTDASTNLSPWGLFIGGEELHNNHHADPVSPKLSKRWFELDIGWLYIKTLIFFNLAQLREHRRMLKHDPFSAPDHTHAVQAILTHRYECLAQFQKSMNKDVVNILKQYGFNKWKHFSRLSHNLNQLSGKKKQKVLKALSNPILQAIHQLECALMDIWNNRKHDMEAAIFAYKKWIDEAKKLSMPHLNQFCERWMRVKSAAIVS